MINIFESNHNEIGSIDKNLIFKTKGKIRIQWNKKFIDLLDNDGNINCGLNKIIKPVKSPDLINKDGFYFLDGNLIACVGGKLITLSSESGNTFVSFLVNQDTTPELKITALKNIGFYADSKKDINITDGIVYVEDEKTLYIINNGNLTKFQAEIPNPYPKQFVITKEDQNSEGSLVITGLGINNSLAFDNLYIYSDNGAVYRSNLHKFIVNDNTVALITRDGIITDYISSNGASSAKGYRIYNDKGKYILDIDSINVRDGLNTSPHIYPEEYYKNLNIITSVKESKDSTGNTISKCYLQYKNNYKPGDKIFIYDSDLNKIEFTVIDSFTDPETGKGYITTNNSNIYEGINNVKCLLNNEDLVIGKIGSKYNTKDTGLISKQTILYSAKFDKEGSGDKIYPFYSNELYSELEPNIENYDNVIPPIGLIKKLELIHSAEYNPSDVKIYFKDYSGKTLNFIDATPFTKDGMVETAVILGGNLIITFNKDANKLNIVLPLEMAIDLSNYYTKHLVDEKISAILLSINDSHYVTPSDIEGIAIHKVSELENDLGFITQEDIDEGVPLGSIILWSFTGKFPDGWHICDGSILNLSEYSEFFAEFGTTKLPDLRGLFPVGFDSRDDKFGTFGSTGGEKEHTLTIDEMPKHDHNWFGDDDLASYTSNWGGSVVKNSGDYDAESFGGYDSKVYTTSKTGGDLPHNNLPPYFVLHFIIKVKNINSKKKILSSENFRFTSNTYKVTDKSSVNPPSLINTYGVPVTYYSSNKNVATAGGGGSLNIISNGVTVISARFLGNEEYKSAATSYTLSVEIEEVSPTPGPEPKILNDDFKYTSNYGEINNSGSSLPTLINTHNLPVTYKSSDKNIAEINSSGVVTDKRNGYCTISAIFKGNSTYKSKTTYYSLWVHKQSSTRTLTDNEFGYTQSSYTITEEGLQALTFNNVYNLSATHTSSNTSVATINSNGVVTVKSNGTTTIKSTFKGNSLYNAKSDEYVLTVNIQEEEDDTEFLAFIKNITESKIDTVLKNVITSENTPKTYSYLKSGYDYVKNTPDATKSWMLANMLAELTPYVISTSDIYKKRTETAGDTATNYFVNAAYSYGGLKLDYLDNELLYMNRIDGAVQYAKFKNSNYNTLYLNAKNSRSELRTKGIDLANRIATTDNYLTVDLVIHSLPLIPNEYPTNSTDGKDWQFTLNIITQYPTPQSTPNNNLALMDKESDNLYFCKILGLDNKYADYLLNCNHIGDVACNQSKRTHSRPRPGTLNNLNIKSGKVTFNIPSGGSVYLCDCSIEFRDHSKTDSKWSPTFDCSTLNNGETYCLKDTRQFTDDTASSTVGSADNPYMSYASGHSSRAFTNLLLALEVFGDSMNVDGYTSRTTRIHLYCLNRAIMRAHWKSDTIAGRFVASMLIGFLNGFSEVNNDMNNIINNNY